MPRLEVFKGPSSRWCWSFRSLQFSGSPSRHLSHSLALLPSLLNCRTYETQLDEIASLFLSLSSLGKQVGNITACLIELMNNLGWSGWSLFIGFDFRNVDNSSVHRANRSPKTEAIVNVIRSVEKLHRVGNEVVRAAVISKSITSKIRRKQDNFPRTDRFMRRWKIRPEFICHIEYSELGGSNLGK